MSSSKVAVVGFELGIINGFHNVRSAHIQYVYNLVLTLLNSGISTHIITNSLRSDTYLPDNLASVPLKFIPDPRQRTKHFTYISGHQKNIRVLDLFKSIFCVVRLIYQEKYTHVHFANGGIGVGSFAAICSLLTNSKCSISWSPSSVPSKKSLKWLAMSFFLKSLKHIICSTDYQANCLKSCNLSPIVIKHGPSRNLSLFTTPKKNRITFWRDPSYSNGADIALQSFIDLAHEFPDIIFTLMVRPHYDPISVPNILPKNIDLYYYPYPKGISLERILSETIACVFPFRALSANPQLSVLETVHAGIPCIVSNVESLPEYVLDKSLVLANNTPYHVSLKIKELLLEQKNVVPISPSYNGYSWSEFSKNIISIMSS